MIVFSLGLPSRFAEWCDLLSARLAACALGVAELVRADTLEEVALAAIRTRLSNLVVGSRQPSARLCQAIAGAGGGFILALDDPRLVLRDLALRNDRSFVDAVRAVARSCASVLGVAESGAALVLSNAASRADPAATANAIVRHFGLGLDAADVARIARDIGDPPAMVDDREAAAWWTGLDERSREVAAGALDAYVALFEGGEIGPIVWERDLFYIGETAGAAWLPAQRPVDITGRSRCLIFGPYLTLPPGDWSATLSLGVSPEAAEMSFVVEIVAGTRLASCRVEPGAERLIEAELRFAVDGSLDQLLEVRVWNERAAFDGRLALGYVTLTPRAPVRRETREFFAAVLRG